MIAIETLVNALNDALNGIIGGYDGETRRFSIIPDGGEYEGYKREYNDITTYIDGVATVTDSSITPISGIEAETGIEVATQALSVAVAVKLEEQKGVDDMEVFLPVRNAISDFAATARTATIDKFTVSITATQPNAGSIEIRPEIGKSIIYTFTVYFTFIQNGVNSREIELTFEGEAVPYQELTITRVPVQDGGAFSGTGGAVKNVTNQTALELNFTTPAIKNNAISKAVASFLVSGSISKAYSVTVKTPYSVNTAQFEMCFGQSHLTSRGVENVGFTVSLVECLV